MAVVIWHNPNCGTSRSTLQIIREAGFSPEVVDYQRTPPSAAEIEAVLREMNIGPRDLLRRQGTPYETLGLDEPGLSDAALIAAMAAHPLLIQRPVVRTDKGTRLCRPPERVREIL
jgi:arsenate reductase